MKYLNFMLVLVFCITLSACKQSEPLEQSSDGTILKTTTAQAAYIQINLSHSRYTYIEIDGMPCIQLHHEYGKDSGLTCDWSKRNTQ